MSRSIFILMLFSLAVTSQGSSLAQRNILTQERTLAQESTQGIVFDTLVHDFGIMEKGSDAECSFTFTNGKEEPLLITQVKASCGCTVPHWPREPVAPGDTGVISVKYNTRSTGRFSKTIMVYTNLDRQAIVLTVKGEVTRKVR